MSDMENLVDALEELTVDQLEQLNRLLAAVRRYMPGDSVSEAQTHRRQMYLRKAVARLRAGLTNDELDHLINELKHAS